MSSLTPFHRVTEEIRKSFPHIASYRGNSIKFSQTAPRYGGENGVNHPAAQRGCGRGVELNLPASLFQLWMKDLQDHQN